MNADFWFEFKYRDRSFKKYILRVSRIIYNSGIDGSLIRVQILFDGNLVSQFQIEFSGTWLSINTGERELSHATIGTLEYSSLLCDLIKDYIFDKPIEDLNKQTIFIDTQNEQSKRILKNPKGILTYHRYPAIVAKENKFAREIVLRELYMIHSVRGPSAHRLVIDDCHFYDQTIRNAIDALKDRNFVQDGKAETLMLTHSGFSIVEDTYLLSPFQNKIFLIAACNDIISKLIHETYRPIVRELGYELKFQEESEPKTTIHEDIWDYLEHSKLILCDLTFQRPNCFIEYGYALAKGKHIILCVEESEGKTKDGRLNVPFDTLTQRYSFWKKEWLEPRSDSYGITQFKNEIKQRIEMKLSLIDRESQV